MNETKVNYEWFNIKTKTIGSAKKNHYWTANRKEKRKYGKIQNGLNRGMNESKIAKRPKYENYKL